MVEIDKIPYPNEIHLDEAIYFVAWQGPVIVLANNKSLECMYFLDGKQAEVDDCAALSFDSELITTYEIQDFYQNDQLPTETKEYLIDDKRILPKENITHFEENAKSNMVSSDDIFP